MGNLHGHYVVCDSRCYALKIFYEENICVFQMSKKIHENFAKKKRRNIMNEYDTKTRNKDVEYMTYIQLQRNYIN
jgi:hypothetical protein